ncbi:hypothetical protein QM012_009043 [Aureobasidium pullulans]|uniref:DUF1640-domain-containing protein n=1 Tax=Aureobasidium pullulans TaxID=5580 RepID=A0ABR0TID9_AURPU
MSTPRLTFLYPFLFTPVGKTPFAREVSRTGRQVFRTASKRSQTATKPIRYGKANEPPPYLAGAKGIAAVLPGQVAPSDAKALPQPTKRDIDTATPKDNEFGLSPGEKPLRPSRLPESPVLDASESQPPGPPTPTPRMPHSNALETVLNMPSSDSTRSASSTSSSSSSSKEQQEPLTDLQKIRKQIEEEAAQRPRPPHIDAPDYVHHFDTYGLVKRLEEGGWSNAQAITIMKATRTTLSENIELARNALVSKSNVENEAYLFRAACSELHTEIMTKRRAEAERARTERTRLEHEVDILSQRMSQDSGNMKDELKGMFDDRKMSVQNEQRDIERKIQELNYRITVLLNSDSRSDVEGVRWIITKRAGVALLACVLMILGSIKFASTAATWQEEERKRTAAIASSSNNNPFGGMMMGANSNSPTNGNGSSNEFMNSAGSMNDRAREELGQGEILVRQGDNPAFVSLG